jgi:hypothetical protein
VSAPNEDRSDFTDTRLFNVLQDYSKKKQVYLDWPEHDLSCSLDQLPSLISTEIDKTISSGQSRICWTCSVVNEHLKKLTEVNKERNEFNKANRNNLLIISLLFYSIVSLLIVMVARELMKFY